MFRFIYLRRQIILLYAIFLFLDAAGRADDKLTQVWGRQLGTSNKETSRSIVGDDEGNSYIAGYTMGKIGDEAFGGNDVIVIKYDNSGNIVWTQQFGTTQDDKAVYITYQKGSIYICGETSGKLGSSHIGGTDAFFSKLNTDGKLLWTKQFGTAADDTANRVVLDDSGNIYFTGSTQGKLANEHYGGKDAYACKYSESGELIWQTQIGTKGIEDASGISIDRSGNVYIAGATDANMGGTSSGEMDIFIALLSPNGNMLWCKQYGTAFNDFATNVIVDKKGYVYVSGHTAGDLFGSQKGGGDGFVCRCDSQGEITWGQQFGTELWDLPWGMILCKDGSNDVLLGGCQHYYPCQAFMRRYDEQGNTKFIYEIIRDSSYGVCGKNISMDNLGNYYITGTTHLDLFDTNKGETDMFIAQFVLDTSSSSEE